MGIISWIVFGIIAGALARWIVPGAQNMGIILTMALGIVGAIVGGWISTLLGLGTVDGFNIGSLVIAVIGALLVLFVWGKVASRNR